MNDIKFTLKDQRLDLRASFCVGKISASPAESFPKIFSGPGDLEGFYRFLHNPRVSLEDLLESIFAHSVSRAQGHQEILAIHDTTEINPQNYSDIEEFKKHRGFFAHVSLLVDGQNRKHIYGPAALKTWADHQPKDKSYWKTQAEQVQSYFSAPLIHLMDREGDAYEIWSELRQENYCFVIRLKYDRVIHDEENKNLHLLEVIREQKPVAQRRIFLSKRKESLFPRSKKSHPSREARWVDLQISAKEVEVNTIFHTRKNLPPTIKINVVRVFEDSQQKDAIEWVLITSQPISTVKEILKVVDLYRSRWIIEEYFKGIKTGLKIEQRYLEDALSWRKILALFLYVCPKILNLRLLANDLNSHENFEPDLSVTQFEILRLKAQRRKKTLLNPEDFLLELANLGGHIKSNGPPGWIVLLKGYLELLTLEEGWRLHAAR